jgi:hypothetical protein
VCVCVRVRVCVCVGYSIYDTNGKFTYQYGINITTAAVGINILEVYLGGLQVCVCVCLGGGGEGEGGREREGCVSGLAVRFCAQSAPSARGTEGVPINDTLSLFSYNVRSSVRDVCVCVCVCV